MPTPGKYASNAERQAAYRARRTSKTGAVGTKPGYRRWDALLRQASTLLETITAEMEAYHEERSESWKDSERGEIFTERMESMEEIVTLIGDLPAMTI